MNLFRTKKPEAMTDAELNAIASDDARVRAVLAECDRRLRAKREADEVKKLEIAAKARKAQVAALLKKHAALYRDRQAAHAQLDVVIVGTAVALETRDKTQRALWAIEREVTALGAPPPLSAQPGFSADAVEAAKKVSTVIQEVAATDSPFMSTVAAQAGRW